VTDSVTYKSDGWNPSLHPSHIFKISSDIAKPERCWPGSRDLCESQSDDIFIDTM